MDRNSARKVFVALIPDVALRKESVDRNDFVAVSPVLDLSRSPQGERG